MSDTLDVRGLRCPWPVLRLAKAMALASEITVWVDDAVAATEITLLARERDWQVTGGDGMLMVSKRPRKASL